MAGFMAFSLQGAKFHGILAPEIERSFLGAKGLESESSIILYRILSRIEIEIVLSAHAYLK